MSDLQNNLFSTGYFKFLDFYGSIHASQMNHFENEDWDDCVINRDFGYDYDVTCQMSAKISQSILVMSICQMSI